jgi:hypothetical protein
MYVSHRWNKESGNVIDEYISYDGINFEFKQHSSFIENNGMYNLTSPFVLDTIIERKEYVYQE